MSEKLPLRMKPQPGLCPYCLEPVGILGNWIAKLMGARFHGCDFSNVKRTAALSDSRTGAEQAEVEG